MRFLPGNLFSCSLARVAKEASLQLNACYENDVLDNAFFSSNIRYWIFRLNDSEISHTPETIKIFLKNFDCLYTFLNISRV